MKLKKITSAGKLAVAGLGLVSLIGCASSMGDAKKDALNVWTQNQTSATEQYKVEKNYFATSLDAKLQTTPNVERSGMTLKTKFGQNSIEYPIGGEPLYVVGDKEYKLSDIFDSFEDAQSPEETKKLQNIFNGYLGDIKNIRESVEKNLENLANSGHKGALKNSTKYTAPLNSSIKSLQQNITAFPDDYDINGVPLTDIASFLWDAYSFIGNGPTETEAAAETSLGTYSEQTFKSTENPDKEATLKESVAVKGNAEFSMDTYLKTKIEEGLPLGEIVGQDVSGLKEMVSISDEQKAELERLGVKIPQNIKLGVPDEYLEGLKKISDTRLPKVSVEGGIRYATTLDYEVQEHKRFNFPINETNRIDIGSLTEFTYSQKRATDISLKAKTNIKNSEITIRYKQTKEEKIANSKTTYVALTHDSHNIFGRAALGTKNTKEQITSETSEYTNRISLDISELDSQSTKHHTSETLARNEKEMMQDALVGVNIPMGRLGAISPYLSLNSEEVNPGFMLESRFADLSVDGNGIRGVVPIVGSASFTKWYKENLLQNPNFVPSDINEMRETRNKHFLNSSGIFLVGDKKLQQDEDLNLKLLLSKKGKFFSYAGATIRDVPVYSLGLGTKNFAVEAIYANGENDNQRVEEYGISAEYNTGDLNLYFNVSSGESEDPQEPFHKDAPRVEAGVIVRY